MGSRVSRNGISSQDIPSVQDRVVIVNVEPVPPAKKINPVVGLKYLCIAAIVYIIIEQIPYGGYIMYPFTIFATFYHEMGHALASILVGFSFYNITIEPDGSGVTYYGFYEAPALSRWFVSFSGPMGPSYVGTVLLLLSATTHRVSRVTLFLFGAILIVATAVAIRGNIFGMIFLPLCGAVVLFLSIWLNNPLMAFVVQFLGVQACCSTYKDMWYFFTDTIGEDANGKPVYSDTGAMGQNLLLPYYFWGCLIVALSGLLFATSLLIVFWRAWRNLKQENSNNSSNTIQTQPNMQESYTPIGTVPDHLIAEDLPPLDTFENDLEAGDIKINMNANTKSFY
ncbi:ATP-dependent zinc metalloprotease FtsH [Acrasis kona]|uniref:ATP-dependent zinc metalloprotease FtsH n=1 Tax=Acrasis kona TaxID=1008807 RepID=A0AAW2ZPA3_9EUKA